MDSSEVEELIQMSFQLEIITPEKKLFTGEVVKLTVPASTGQITILTNHLPLFTNLGSGSIRFTANNKETKIPISKGLLEVQKGKSILLVEPPESEAELAAQKHALTEKPQELKPQKTPAQAVIATEDAFRRSFIDFEDVKRKRRTPLSASLDQGLTP